MAEIIMQDIKIKTFVHTKDSLDIASDIGNRTRRSLMQTEERARTLADDGQGSSTEYASNQLLDTEEDVVYDVGYIAIDTFNLSRRTMVKAIRTSPSRSKSDTEGETPLEDSPTVPTDNQVANPSTPDTVDSLQPSPEAHQPPVSTPQQPSTNIQNATPQRNAPHRPIDRALHNGLPSMQSPKPRNTTIKTAQRTVKDSIRTIKTTNDVGQTSAKAAHKSAQTAQNASHRVAGFLDKTARATVPLGKAVTNAAKSIVTYIASGGWIILLVVSIIIIIIVIIAAAAGYLDPSITIPE